MCKKAALFSELSDTAEVDILKRGLTMLENLAVDDNNYFVNWYFSQEIQAVKSTVLRKPLPASIYSLMKMPGSTHKYGENRLKFLTDEYTSALLEKRAVAERLIKALQKLIPQPAQEVGQQEEKQEEESHDGKGIEKDQAAASMEEKKQEEKEHTDKEAGKEEVSKEGDKKEDTDGEGNKRDEEDATEQDEGL